MWYVLCEITDLIYCNEILLRALRSASKTRAVLSKASPLTVGRHL